MKKGGSDFYIVRELVTRFIDHNVTASGAQMAYFLLLMLFPFLMFLVAVLGFMEIPTDDAIYFLSNVAPKEVMQIISKYIEYILTDRQGDLLLVSAFASFWTASNALNALINSVNQSYGIAESRSYLKRKLLVIPFTLLVTLSISGALTIPVLGKGFLLWASRYIRISFILIEYLAYLRWLVALFTIFNVFTILYYITPNKKVSYGEIIPGAAFATMGWLLISSVISLYFSSVRGYAVIYGSIGAVIILMIWLYWGAIILILGGELNAILFEGRMFKQDKKSLFH
ncbi:MAG: YihY/virulence factor BrkB family protein [Bacillota bacterium]